MKSSLLTLGLCLIFGGGLLTQNLDAQNWTHWRGPNQNGISTEANLVETFSLEPEENVLWQSDIGGRATPIVLNGKVYISCRTNEDMNDDVEKVNVQERVVCWDAESGDLLWEDRFNVFQTDIPAPRVGWAAMCGDEETGFVYMHSVCGLFRCYDDKGNVIWEKSLLEEFGKISGYGGRTQTPIIDEDRVIVSFMVNNWGDQKLPPPKQTYYAFDKKTGDLQWVSAPGGAPQDTNYSVPFVTVLNGTRMLIGGNSDGGIYAINARTGTPIWGFRMSLRGLNSSPVIDGKYVYISHGEDNIDNNSFGRIQCVDATGTGDVTETHSVWRHDELKAGYTGLLVKDGVLYVVSDTGNLYAFDGEKGDLLWDHDLGTVGKGSPVWADGKIYVTETNGRIHILKADREGCESLCMVHLKAVDGNGDDEIYASPAISNGRIYFVTRDRTFCIAAPDREVSIAAPEALAEETASDNKIALIQLRPYEVALNAGDSVEFTAVGFDKNGRVVKEWSPALKAGEGMADLQIDGNKISVPALKNDAAGTVTVEYEGLSAQARVRFFNSEKVWSWDFNDYAEMQVPPSWIRAFGKLKPTDVDGNIAMKMTGIDTGRGRPSHYVWLGKADMSNYTIQSDVRFVEKRRQRPKIGVTANRYNLVIKANDLPEELKRDRDAVPGMLVVQSWAPQLRMAKSEYFPVEVDTWYTLKLKVEVKEDGARIYGKAWKTGSDEPDEWTLEAFDPHANEAGAPGLYVSALADAYWDNIIVIQHDE